MTLGIVGQSRAIGDVIRRIDLVAASCSSTALITGETGTGKELVARAVHTRSARCERPFIKVNCAAIPEHLLESELFGHVRGAFTGAVGHKRGKFALAHRGSIFLDEVGTISVGLQSKLLRVLQEREFEPVGAERTEQVDVRVIAATNRDLYHLVSEGRFQADLFYRLHVVPIVVPPLRERLSDVPILAAHFADTHGRRNGKPIDAVADEAIAALLQHDWPGNVRELENTIERAVVLANGPVITADLITVPAANFASGATSLKLRHNLEWIERETIRRALAAAPVKHQAARLLGISPRALAYYLAKHPPLDRAALQQ